MESNAPALINDSTVRLLSTLRSTRSMKSWNDAKGPFFSRSSRINSTTPSPTFLTAERPNVIAPSLAAKSDSEELTSGTITRSPIDRHSLR